MKSADTVCTATPGSNLGFSKVELTQCTFEGAIIRPTVYIDREAIVREERPVVEV
ncbi:MAG: hypothetical protein RMI45_01180 [Ignisphaera sp.]|nr:hypothetical protein [Ignisphaera sp.]MDW8084840.1 hypothetical protein [Ignisphaera sp.]